MCGDSFITRKIFIFVYFCRFIYDASTLFLYDFLNLIAFQKKHDTNFQKIILRWFQTILLVFSILLISLSTRLGKISHEGLI